MKFSIKNLFSKCDQIRSFLRIWSHLPKKSSMENFIFVQCNMFLLVKRFAKCCKLCFSSPTNFFPLSYMFYQKKKEFDSLTLSWWRSISDRNESICKLMEWFLCNRELRHERVKVSIPQCVCENTRGNYSCKSHWHDVLTQHKTYC